MTALGSGLHCWPTGNVMRGFAVLYFPVHVSGVLMGAKRRPEQGFSRRKGCHQTTSGTFFRCGGFSHLIAQQPISLFVLFCFPLSAFWQLQLVCPRYFAHQCDQTNLDLLLLAGRDFKIKHYSGWEESFAGNLRRKGFRPMTYDFDIWIVIPSL